MDLNKKNKDIKKDEVKQIANTTNNNLFLSSTADLQKLLNGKDDSVIDVTARDVSRESSG